MIPDWICCVCRRTSTSGASRLRKPASLFGRFVAGRFRFQRILHPLGTAIIQPVIEGARSRCRGGWAAALCARGDWTLRRRPGGPYASPKPSGALFFGAFSFEGLTAGRARRWDPWGFFSGTGGFQGSHAYGLVFPRRFFFARLLCVRLAWGGGVVRGDWCGGGGRCVGRR